MDPRIRQLVETEVRIHVGSADDLSGRGSASVDVVFASNVFEHFPTKERVLMCLRKAFRVLRDGGRSLVLQPNIRFTNREYGDFFDHHRPFRVRALREGLGTCGFRIDEQRPRFLPFTTKVRLPLWPVLVWLYLRVPLAERVPGTQMFIVATKPGGARP